MTSLGSGVDGTVRRRQATHDTFGRPLPLTTWSAAWCGSVVNQIAPRYHGRGSVSQEWQVVTCSVIGSGASVQYAVDESLGRVTGMSYPYGRTIGYTYAGGAGHDSLLNRVSSLVDGATILKSYTYLCTGTVVERSRPQPGHRPSVIKLSGEPNANGGDQYTGFDRFSRIIDQRLKLGESDRTLHSEDMNEHDNDSSRRYFTAVR